MSVIVPISMIRESADEGVAAHRARTMPVLVISPHNQCNCRCVMCDIWRIREPREITPTLLERQLASFRELGVRWVVFTGGEPQLNAQMIFLAQILRAEGIRIPLLTAGLLLESHAESIAANVDDVIISLDGPPAVHDQIRRIPHAFEQIRTGVEALRGFRPQIIVRARCTVQKANYHSLCKVVKSAKEIRLNSISFLAADLTSEAFNRPQAWAREQQQRGGLN